ncbi:MAG: NTP transferase domain-containing protein, partial [Comamonadaceae bacterium]|nr:NTP transferase domain-containing protein [Comamonadaceae bacterium]
MTTAALDLIIMAAGKGTRMKSRIPKVLQHLAGRPLLAHVLAAAAPLQPRRVVVVTGHGAMEVEAASAGWTSPRAGFDLQFVRQEPQLGTGHAVQQAMPRLADDGTVVVLSGDVPLTRPETLQALVQASAGERLALLTVRLPDPTGYGRIVRGADGMVQRIVEHKDASVGERVNYGAGSITANYDGANKHRTVIEADAHIGSNCVLVAPVTIGAGGTVGGGSTIT